MNKKIYLIAIICFIFGFTSCLAQSNARSLNRIVAIVNDDIITQTQLNEAIAQAKQEFTVRHLPLPPEKKLREEALQQLIDYRLELQLVSRLGIQVKDSEVDAAVEQIAKQHNLSSEQLQQQLQAEKTNFQEFRSKLGEQLAVNKLQQQAVANKVKITPEDIAEYQKKYQKAYQAYQEYHFLDFLIPLPENPTSADISKALAQARELRQKLDLGQNPSQLSPAPIDLGWRSRADLPEVFTSQLTQFETSKVSQPIRAPNGYHLLKLLETRNAATGELSENKIRDVVYRQKFAEEVKKWLETMRTQAYIQIISP